MENIDAVQINFNKDQLLLLNVCLSFLMFGVALDIRTSDFKYLLKRPKAVLVGLTSQLVLLPILTFFLVCFFNPPVSMALGMILIGVCPGGNVSNFAVHLSRANAALSVSLTSIVTMLAIFWTPMCFNFWAGLVEGSDNLEQNIYVNFIDMFKTIVTLIVIPLFLGMFVNHRYPELTKKIEHPIKVISIIIFLGFVVVASYSNFQNIIDHLGKVFLIVMVHNALALTLGYWFARLNNLQNYDARAISIETGIQNSGLALILIFNFFDGLGGMAMIAAWWGVWHLITGFFLATFWSKRRTKSRMTDNRSTNFE